MKTSREEEGPLREQLAEVLEGLVDPDLLVEPEELDIRDYRKEAGRVMAAVEERLEYRRRLAAATRAAGKAEPGRRLSLWRERLQALGEPVKELVALLQGQRDDWAAEQLARALVPVMRAGRLRLAEVTAVLAPQSGQPSGMPELARWGVFGDPEFAGREDRAAVLADVRLEAELRWQLLEEGLESLCEE